MIIPVRCVTCGKVICDKWRAYQALTGESQDAPDAEDPKRPRGVLSRKEAMDSLGLVRYCCRRHFISQVDLVEKI